MYRGTFTELLLSVLMTVENTSVHRDIYRVVVICVDD